MPDTYTLSWDGTGQRLFETGVRNVVLYTKTGTNDAWKGYAWNGVTSISESPEGADLNDIYADDIKYASIRAAETFGGSIEAYTYPDAWAACDGSVEIFDGITIGQQARREFALCYRTAIGSDEITDLDTAYKLHIVYGCTASPSERSYETINDSPDAITFSWDFSSTPVTSTGNKPVSCLTIDSTKIPTAKAAKLTSLLTQLYGNGTNDATLLMPDEIAAHFAAS